MLDLRSYVGGVRFGALGKLYFSLQRKRQYFGCKVDPSLSERPDIVRELDQEGIFVLPNFASREVCEAILAETKARVDAGLQGVPDPACGMSAPNHIRLLKCDEISPTAKREFFDNSLIDGIAKAYVSPHVWSGRREIDVKKSVNQFLQADLVHFDDWRHRFKAFLYLTDVGANNAPFVYYRRSHRPAPWRVRHELEFELGGVQARHGHLFPQELPTIFGSNQYPEQICIAPAGTLILADFRGLHRASILKEGYRAMLNKTFTMPRLLLEHTLLGKKRARS